MGSFYEGKSKKYYQRSIIALPIILVMFFVGIVVGRNSKTFFNFLAKEETSKTTSETVVNEQTKQPVSFSIDVINDSVVDVFRYPDTNSERVTQTLFCQQVKILEEGLEWSRVEAADGYIGWIKSDKIDKTFNNITPAKVIVKSKLKDIYSEINGTSPIKQVTLGTELYCISKTNNWYQVALPMNTAGWIEDKDTLQVQTGIDIPKTTGSKFVETAKKFLEVPYLWGGVGAGGIDCSGLTYICGRVNGVDLPRDAQPQHDAISTSIKPTAENMKAGDLIFFSSKVSSKAISHVGIYIGKNEFIEASGGDGEVTITSLSDNYYKERIVGVKRIFEN